MNRPVLSSDTMIDEVGGIFAALGDPSRLRILRTLLDTREPLNQAQIAERSALSQANASKHLSCLVRAGLLTRTQDGNAAHYHLVEPLVKNLCLLVGSHVTQRAAHHAQTLA